jgi:hypothetical protein
MARVNVQDVPFFGFDTAGKLYKNSSKQRPKRRRDGGARPTLAALYSSPEEKALWSPVVVDGAAGHAFLRYRQLPFLAALRL